MDSTEDSAQPAAGRGAHMELMRLGREMRRRVRTRMPLGDVLRELGERMAADAVLLVVPGCRLRMAVGVREKEMTLAIASEFESLEARLAGQSDSVDCPEGQPRIIQGEDPPAACRLILLPVDAGSNRIPVWLAFARELKGERFDTYASVLAQVQAMRLGPRLMREIDHVTGHLSRAGLRTLVAHRRVDAGALVLLDLDGLRTINHTQGQAMGDVAVRVLARLMATPLLPKNSFVARIDGGKFAILMPDRDADQGVRAASRLQRVLGEVEVRDQPDLPKLTISAGVAEYDFPNEPFERSLLAADHVLRMAKERGVGRIETHKSNDASVIRRVDEDFVAADLREALRSGDLELYAQPIVAMREGRHPPGFELLLRLRGEEGVEGSASRLVHVAQRFSLLPVLDRYVVDRAFEILAPHRAVLAAQRATVSINVSGASLGSTEFTTAFIEKLKASQVPPGCIVVEITEQVALSDTTRAGETMRRLRAAGCGIAIDDFGTGANSLAYVHQLPVTRLKIDGSFITDITTNKRSEAAVRGIVQLARDFVLQTVGEHVETREQAAFLRRLGVDFGQGYLFGRPEPLDDAIRGLKDRGATTISLGRAFDFG